MVTESRSRVRLPRGRREEVMGWLQMGVEIEEIADDVMMDAEAHMI